MEYNCFACTGINQECVNQRTYVPYDDEESCLNKTIAKQDEIRLRKGDFGSIKLRDMLARHLFSIGEKQKALELLM